MSLDERAEISNKKTWKKVSNLQDQINEVKGPLLDAIKKVDENQCKYIIYFS